MQSSRQTAGGAAAAAAETMRSSSSSSSSSCACARCQPQGRPSPPQPLPHPLPTLDYDNCPECVKWRVAYLPPSNAAYPHSYAAAATPSRSGAAAATSHATGWIAPPPAISPSSLNPLSYYPLPLPADVAASVQRALQPEPFHASPAAPASVAQADSMMNLDADSVPERRSPLELLYEHSAMEEDLRREETMQLAPSTAGPDSESVLPPPLQEFEPPPLPASSPFLTAQHSPLPSAAAVAVAGVQLGRFRGGGRGSTSPDPLSIRILGLPATAIDSPSSSMSTSSSANISSPSLSVQLQSQQQHQRSALSSATPKPKRFSSSSFLYDAMESPPPPPDDLPAGALAEDRDAVRAAAKEAAESESAASAEAPEPLGIEDSLLKEMGRIGDVSVPPLPNTQDSAYQPIMLSEDFLSQVHIGPNATAQESKQGDGGNNGNGGNKSQQRRSSVPKVGNNKPDPNRETPPSRSTRLTQDQGGEPLRLRLSLPLTPAPKRPRTRRNSDVVSSYNAGARQSRDGTATAATSSAVKTSHKRKTSSEDTIMPPASDGDEQSRCTTCAHCVECAKHWRSIGATAGGSAKHDPEHGHVHSRASAPSSPLTQPAAAAAAAAASGLGLTSISAKLAATAAAPPSAASVLPPQHPVSAAPSSPPQSSGPSFLNSSSSSSSANRNHIGGSLKSGWALRSSESVCDSPQHTSLALSPALRSRRLHHSMRRGHAYEVSCILDVRVRRGELEYLVAWTGYPDIFNSWEPATALMQASAHIVSEFEETRGKVAGGDDDEGDEEGDDAASSSSDRRDSNQRLITSSSSSSATSPMHFTPSRRSSSIANAMEDEEEAAGGEASDEELAQIARPQPQKQQTQQQTQQ